MAQCRTDTVIDAAPSEPDPLQGRVPTGVDSRGLIVPSCEHGTRSRFSTHAASPRAPTHGPRCGRVLQIHAVKQDNRRIAGTCKQCPGDTPWSGPGAVRGRRTGRTREPGGLRERNKGKEKKTQKSGRETFEEVPPFFHNSPLRSSLKQERPAGNADGMG